MKRYILSLSLIIAALTSFSQIHVKEGSFHKIDGYVMLDKMDHLDDNNVPMALIKISTENISAEERRKMTFKGNLATYFDVQFEPSEIHLYLSTTATFLEIHHPDYGKTEYWLPEDLCDFCGYELVVVSDYMTERVVEEKLVYVNVPTTGEMKDAAGMNEPKRDFFVSVNYACTDIGISSYGITFGEFGFHPSPTKSKKLNWYINLMSNFNFKTISDLECDKDGLVDGKTHYYTGNVEKIRHSFLLGLMFKVAGPVYLKAGVGVGHYNIAWEDTNKYLVRNVDYSDNGLDANAGLMLKLGKLNASFDVVTTNLKNLEFKLGLGVNL